MEIDKKNNYHGARKWERKRTLIRYSNRQLKEFLLTKLFINS